MLDLFFRHSRIRSRIIVLILIPVIGMLIPSYIVLKSGFMQAQEMQKLEMLADLAPTISALVHEMQKERGASAGFTGSQGKKFADILPNQRKNTDAKRKELLKALSVFDKSSYGAVIGRKIDAATTALTKLDKTRTQISGLKLSVPQLAKYFTGTIGKFLTIIEEMIPLSSHAETTRQIAGYTSFLQGKERAGIERAMGAGGFGAGEFSWGIMQRFIQLIASQDIYIRQFKAYATDDSIAVYDKKVRSPIVAEVARMRKVAVSSVESGDLQGIDGPAWFKAITQKINILKEVEDSIANGITKSAQEISSESWIYFYIQLAVFILTSLLTIFLGMAIISSITTPLNRAMVNLRMLGEGNVDLDFQGDDRKDEAGELIRLLKLFRENKVKADALAEAQHIEQGRQAKRGDDIQQMSDEFEHSIHETLIKLDNANKVMSQTSDALQETAKLSSSQASSVAAAAEEAATNVQTVAAAAEELAASTNEIGLQVDQSSKVAEESQAKANDAAKQVRGLEEAAAEISNAVSLITDIAEQTNLLALNATIEAARAGDAGKGFAVVANEVKSLANQTAQATEQISTQVAEIQSATGQAVQAIDTITKTVQNMTHISASVAAAVEEQEAATNEIARNVEEAFQGTQEVASNIAGVSESAKDTGAAAQEAASSSSEVSQGAETLRSAVQAYLDGIKAA